MRKAVALSLLVFLVAVGCDGSSKKIYIDTRDIGPACAAYTACFGFYGMNTCVRALDLLRHYEIQNMTLELAELNIVVDWIEMLALAQNVKCVVSAEGDCEKVLACMNQGMKNLNCTPYEDHILGYHCIDGTKLAKCTVVQGRFYTTVEFSIDCASMGLKCAEILVDGEDNWVACVNEKVDVTGDIKVTCDGTAASITFGGGVLSYDCAYRGGTCVPASYVDIDLIKNRKFCYSPSCDRSTFEERCEGNNQLYCYDGRQVSMPCDELGLVCSEVISDTVVEAICAYPNCNSPYHDESCDDETITYCGPGGQTSISCKDLGFIGCGTGPGGILVRCH